MKLSEVQKLLDARVLGGEEYLDRQIAHARRDTTSRWAL